MVFGRSVFALEVALLAVRSDKILIEVIADEPMVQKIVEKLGLEYFPHYAVSCWVSDVQILREDRY
jgi:hypothetical protein